MGDRVRLRKTVDSAAVLYDRARPQYPVELFDRQITYTAQGYIDLLNTFQITSL